MNVHFRGLSRVGLVLLGVTLIAAPAAHAEDKPHFSAKDIRRSYGFSCSGTVVASPALPPGFLGPFAQVGQVSCDGKDTCVGTSMASFNGNILSAAVTGIYNVNPNGTGLVTYDLTIGGAPAGQLPIYFVITDGGRGIKGLPTSSGYAVTCDLKEQ
jgi:hypothetical protein